MLPSANHATQQSQHHLRGIHRHVIDAIEELRQKHEASDNDNYGHHLCVRELPRNSLLLRHASIDYLVQYLYVDRSIASLEMNYCHLGQSILQDERVLELLVDYLQHETACSIIRLQLGGNRLGDNATATLLQALEKNRTVRQLDLNTNYIERIGDVIAHYLASTSCLERLTLSYNWLSNTSMADLSQGLTLCPTLCELNLHGCVLGNDGIKPLVEALLLSNNTSDIGGGLQVLRLGLTEITDVAILARLVEANTALRVLDLSWNPEILTMYAEDDFEPTTTTNNRSVEDHSMNQDSRNTGEQDVSDESEMNAPDTQQLQLLASSRLGKALAHNTTLKTLVLTRCGFSIRTVQPIWKALTINTTLTTLDLRENSIFGDDIVDLESLEQPPWSIHLPRIRGLRTLHLDLLPPSMVKEKSPLQLNFSLFSIVISSGKPFPGATTSPNYNHHHPQELMDILVRNRIYEKVQQALRLDSSGQRGRLLVFPLAAHSPLYVAALHLLIRDRLVSWME